MSHQVLANSDVGISARHESPIVSTWLIQTLEYRHDATSHPSSFRRYSSKSGTSMSMVTQMWVPLRTPYRVIKTAKLNLRPGDGRPKGPQGLGLKVQRFAYALACTAVKKTLS